MRRFFITNEEKFIGDAEVLFNDKGTLCKIDVTQCQIDESVVLQLKQAIPPNLSKFITGQAFGKDTKIIEADLEVSFDMFWDGYRHKINRIRCLKLWGNMSKVEQVSAFYGIKPYDKYLSRQSWRTKADPETYLKNKMWENEWK